MKKYEEDWDDIQEALGKVSYDFVPEQERNFDADYTPTESPRKFVGEELICLLYTSPSPRDLSTSRMPSSA